MTTGTAAARRISVVLPVYRNRAQLPELCSRLEETLSGLTDHWELVWIEDGGDDGAREWLVERCRSDPRMILVANPANLGQHLSILRGLGAAHGELVAVMDADLQDAPEDLARLVAAWSPGLGAVFAQRRLPYQSAVRQTSGRLFKRLLRRIVGGRLPPGVGTFVVIGRPALDRILAMPVRRPYLPLLVARAGLPLATVDIDKQPRIGGRSAYSVARRLQLAVQALIEAIRWRAGR